MTLQQFLRHVGSPEDRAASPLQVNVTSCKGFASESMFWEVAKRTVRNGLPTTFLILVDRDRAGNNMADNIVKTITRLVALAAKELKRKAPPVEFVRIGLNAEQVTRYNVRTRGPKSTEHAGMKNFVQECAEVDFLRSAQIEEIVREGIEAQIDATVWAASHQQQEEDREWLRKNL